MENNNLAMNNYVMVNVKIGSNTISKIIPEDEYLANCNLRRTEYFIAVLCLLVLFNHNELVIQKIIAIFKEQKKYLIDNYRRGIPEPCWDYDSARKLNIDEYRGYIISKILE